LIKIFPPVAEAQISSLKIFDRLVISGPILAGRDAALPRLVRLVAENRLAETGLDLRGAVIFHTAVSPAGIGPTSSNKEEIENSIPALSRAGVKIHLGKGSLHPETVASLCEHGAIFAVTPPVSALLTSKIRARRVAAFPEEGMEALYLLEVAELPAIVAAAHGQSVFNLNGAKNPAPKGGERQ